MVRQRLCALIGAMMVVVPTTGALAADYTPQPVPSGYEWYLRGYLGLTAEGFHGLDHPDFAIPAYEGWLDPGQFSAAPLFGLGIGISTGNHLRFDVTGEYHGKASFSALQEYDTDSNPPNFDGAPGPDWGTDAYTAKKSEWVFLANGYLDLGNWRGFSPYVGAGIGAAYNSIFDFLDDNVPAAGQGWAPTGHKWNLAWALHAGAGIQVTNNLTIDLGYSFTNVGNAQTGNFQNVDPNIACLTPGCPPVTFKKIYSHDFKLGVRWALN